MAKLADLGVFELVYPKSPAFRYRFQVGYADGTVQEHEDPYRFLPTISEQDLFLIGKGDDHKVFNKLGSHVRTLEGGRCFFRSLGSVGSPCVGGRRP